MKITHPLISTVIAAALGSGGYGLYLAVLHRGTDQPAPALASGQAAPYYLRTSYELSPTAGTAPAYKDVALTSVQSCPNRPFSPFGTWSLAQQ